MADSLSGADLKDRLAKLSPAQREALQKLMAKPKPAAPRPAEADPGPTMEQAQAASDPVERMKQFYEVVNRNLNAAEYGSYAVFLNYGFVPASGTESRAVVELPRQYLNRNSVRLVLELVGDTPLEGKAALDVGCGRGGTVSVLRQYFKPRRAVGLDLCRSAVVFSQATHGRKGTGFVNGNAQQLPFADRSFDVVSNVESSHTYPAVEDFYTEVRRVLAPGGVFLYTDVIARDRLEPSLAVLGQLGFRIEIARNITPNVLASLDENATTHMQSLGASDDNRAMGNFLAAPGSDVYRRLQEGDLSYRMFRLRL